MKKFKSLLAMVLVIMMIFSLTACSSTKETDNKNASVTEVPKDNNEATPTSATPAAGGYTFGIAMPQLDNDGFKANLVGIKQKAEELGITIITSDAKGNADTQMQQIEDFITRGVDAIVMCPIDSGALAAAVQKANTAGIPISSFDRNVSGGILAGLAESDNIAHGAKAAELMAEAAEKNGVAISDLKVLELLGTISTNTGLQRHEGFSKRAEELGIEIVASLPTEYKMDIAYSAVLDAFQANDKINAIFVASDNALYSGVESALLQLKKLNAIGEEGHIIVTTVDGGPQGLAGIRAGFIDGIAAQSKLIMSYEAVMLAYKTLTGEKIDQTVVRILPIPVTIDNVDDETLWANAINKKE